MLRKSSFPSSPHFIFFTITSSSIDSTGRILKYALQLLFHRSIKTDLTQIRIHTFSVTHRRVLDAVLDGEKLFVFMTQIDEMPTVIDRFIENVLYPIICPGVIGVKPEAPLKAELPIRIAGSNSSTLEFDSVLNLVDEENGSYGSSGTTVDSSILEYDHNGDTDDTDSA